MRPSLTNCCRLPNVQQQCVTSGLLHGVNEISGVLGCYAVSVDGSCSGAGLPQCITLKQPCFFPVPHPRFLHAPQPDWLASRSLRTNRLPTYVLTYLLTYLHTPWSRVLLEKIKVSRLVKKFPAFYGTRRFITAFTSARHLSLSRASSIQSIPHIPLPWRSILILSSHLRLGLPRYFSLRFPHQNPLYTSAVSQTCYLLHSYPSHPSRFDYPKNIGWEVQIIKFLIM